MIPQPLIPIPILIPPVGILISTSIPGFTKYYHSDSDFDSSGPWFRFRLRFQGFPNSMILIPIVIPVIHDSDSNSDSRDSQIFWFRFQVSDFDSNFDSNPNNTYFDSMAFWEYNGL